MTNTRSRRSTKSSGIVRTKLTEAKWPNHVWAVDFKGKFATLDGNDCLVLTGSDLHSRYILMCEAMTGGTLEDVRSRMIRCFKQYGLPEVIRVDNGSPFGSASRGALGLSKLSVWWIKLGISVEYIDVGCPDQNATHERMHGSYKREVISEPAMNCRLQQVRNRRWVQYFNDDRPHESLNGGMPKEHYELSVRTYEGVLSYQYPTDWTIRRVHQKGDICWLGRKRFIGEAFANESIGLEPTDSAHVWRLWFRQHLIGKLHQSDLGGMRPKLLQRPKRRKLSK